MFLWSLSPLIDSVRTTFVYVAQLSINQSINQHSSLQAHHAHRYTTLLSIFLPASLGIWLRIFELHLFRRNFRKKLTWQHQHILHEN